MAEPQKQAEAKGMKNFISHQYGDVDDALVFNAITKELEKDVSLFIEQIKKSGDKKLLSAGEGWSDINTGKLIKDIYKDRKKGTKWDINLDKK